jgi:TRAP-type C4-dicarboxylate transport system substrate-binding protein
MKKNMWVVLLIGICLVFPFTASSEPITMTFTTQNPENGWGQVMALKPWVEQVEKAAKGYSQTLNKGPATWKAVKDGIADIGWGFHAYWRGMTSLSDVISLPSLPFNTSEEASGALWKLYIIISSSCTPPIPISCSPQRNRSRPLRISRG